MSNAKNGESLQRVELGNLKIICAEIRVCFAIMFRFSWRLWQVCMRHSVDEFTVYTHTHTNRGVSMQGVSVSLSLQHTKYICASPNFICVLLSHTFKVLKALAHSSSKNTNTYNERVMLQLNKWYHLRLEIFTMFTETTQGHTHIRCLRRILHLVHCCDCAVNWNTKFIFYTWLRACNDTPFHA